MLSLRSHGWVREQPADSHLRVDVDEFMRLFRFVLPGYNIRPLEMSGALGQEQLRKLPRLVAARRANAITFKELFENHPDVAIQRETGESSWFGFAFTLRGALAGRRLELVEALRGADIETRPIVSGNFLNNPAVEYLQYSVSGEMRAAQRIDEDGLFIGNHHFAVSDALARCREIVDAVGARGPAWNRNMSRPNRLPAAVVGSPLRERAVA
jgi:CDP-6-deoxy-D-xylo-4-hexulose-3-dehydrase